MSLLQSLLARCPAQFLLDVCEENESTLINRGVDGVLISPLPVGRRNASLDLSRFAVAKTGHSLVRPKWPKIWNPEVILSGNSQIMETLTMAGMPVPEEIDVTLLDLASLDKGFARSDQHPEWVGAGKEG